MRHDHRPLWLKRLYDWCNRRYVAHFIRPQLDYLGDGSWIIAPRHLVICGPGIRIGRNAHLICASDNKIRLTVWPRKWQDAALVIGDHCLLSPGVRLSAQQRITVGDNCMLGANCYLSDSDWHGLYNRLRSPVRAQPIVLADNVWLGDSVIVTKGVTIGANTVVGAGSVVSRDLPANVVAAGNPARVVKTLDPKRRMLRRQNLFADGVSLQERLADWDRALLAGNGLGRWLRSRCWPTRRD